MEASQILSVELIDVVFDGRNKAYGAYDLRKTYSKRINTALFITLAVTFLAIGAVVMANSSGKKEKTYRIIQEVELSRLDDKKKPEPIHEPEKKSVKEQVQTQKFTPLVIVQDKDFKEPPPTQADLDSSLVDIDTRKGKPFNGTSATPPEIDNGKGIIQPKENSEPEGPRETVDIHAKFNGKWEFYLLKNLKGEIPVENGAPAGRYTVVIQFVVDKDGIVSDLKALTNHGFGMEEEAIRVIKKSPAWEPAIYDGYKVKAYHRQPITFNVLEE